MEATQTIEKENYQLRQQISGLMTKLKEASNDQAQKATERVTLIKLRKMQTNAMDMKYELQQTKRYQESELDTMRDEMTVAFRSATAHLLAGIMGRDKRIMQLEMELRNLKATPVVKEVVDTAELRRQQDLLDAARKQIAVLNDELSKSEKRKLELTEESRNMKQSCDAALRDAKQWSNKYDVLAAEYRRLKSRLSVVEYESREAIDTAVKAEVDTREQCEKILVDFESENTYLFKRICELEAEVDRLRQLSAVPKADNNFAKFVQLKSENVALKTQLNTAATARNRLALLGTRGDALGPPLGPATGPQSASASFAGTSTAMMAGPSHINPSGVPDDDENSYFGDDTLSVMSVGTRTSKRNGPLPSKSYESTGAMEDPKMQRRRRSLRSSPAHEPKSQSPSQSHSQSYSQSNDAHHPLRDLSVQTHLPVRSKPIDDSDDEFSPMKRKQPAPSPFPGPPHPQQRQKGQATVAGVIHATSSFDIGVPLLNKQTRSALKDRIVV